MGSSKKPKQNKNHFHSLKKSYGIKTSAVNALANMKKNGDSKNLSRLAIMACLKSACSVQVEDISYVLKGRRCISLSEMSESCDREHQYKKFTEEVNGVAGGSASDDEFGLKIVETYSLATTVKHNEALSEKESISYLAQYDKQKNMKSMDMDVKSNHFLNRFSSHDYATQSTHSQAQAGFPQQLVPEGESVSATSEQDNTMTSSHSLPSDTKSVFCSSLLDDMLASENKVLEGDMDCISEPWAIDIGNVKYSTPTCQASYVKTLSTALQERREIEAKLQNQHCKPETCVSAKLTTNYAKAKKPMFDLTKVRTTLQKSHGSKFRRDNAVTDILSGLPNMHFLNKSPRYKTGHGCPRFRSMLQDITLCKADFAASAVVDPGNIPFNGSFSRKLSEKNAGRLHCFTATSGSNGIKKGAKLALPKKYGNQSNNQLNPLKRFSSSSTDAPVFKKRNRQRKNILQIITKDMANMALTALVTHFPLSLNGTCISTTSELQPKKLHRNDLRKCKVHIKRLKRNLFSLQPLSLKVAVAKYLVYKAKKQSAAKKLQDYVALHFAKLPINCVRDEVHRHKQLKLKLAKHKLLWKEVKMSDGVVIYPELYSAPKTATTYKPVGDTMESCTCARTRGDIKKCSNSSLNTVKKMKCRSKGSLANQTGKKSNCGMVLLRLSCSAKKDESAIYVKIISLCDWSNYTEEIMDLIVGCHRELAVMQRGKYLRTDVGDCIFEVLREVAGRIIFDHLPLHLRNEIDIPHWKYVSLVKISPRPTKRSNNTVNLDRTINFAVAIEDMLQLNKEVSKTKNPNMHSINVKSVCQDRSCITNSGSQVDTTKSDDTFKLSVVDKLKSCDLSKLAEKMENQSKPDIQTMSSSVYEIDEASRQKFQVGRIGCLNKFTANLSTQNATGSALNYVSSEASISKSLVQQTFVSNSNQTATRPQGINQGGFSPTYTQLQLPKVKVLDDPDKTKSPTLTKNRVGVLAHMESSSSTSLSTTNLAKNQLTVCSNKPNLTTYSSAKIVQNLQPGKGGSILAPVSSSSKATSIFCVPISLKVVQKQMKPLLTFNVSACKVPKKPALRIPQSSNFSTDCTSAEPSLKANKQFCALVTSPQKQPVSAVLHAKLSEKLSLPKNAKISVIASQACNLHIKPASVKTVTPEPIVLHQVSCTTPKLINCPPVFSTKCFVDQNLTQKNSLLKAIPLGKLPYQPITVKSSASITVMPYPTVSFPDLQVFSTLHGQHKQFAKPQVVSSLSSSAQSSSQLCKKIIPNTEYGPLAPVLTTSASNNQVPLKCVRVVPTSIAALSFNNFNGKKEQLIACSGIKQSSTQTFSVALHPTENCVQTTAQNLLKDLSSSSVYTSNVTTTSTTSTTTNNTLFTSSLQQPVLSSSLFSLSKPVAESRAFEIKSSEFNQQQSVHDKVKTAIQLPGAVDNASDKTLCIKDCLSKTDIISTNQDDHKPPSRSTFSDSGQSFNGKSAVCSEANCSAGSPHKQEALRKSLSDSSLEANNSKEAPKTKVEKDIIVAQEIHKTNRMENQGLPPFVQIKHGLKKPTNKLVYARKAKKIIKVEEVIDVCEWEDEEKEMLRFLGGSVITARKVQKGLEDIEAAKQQRKTQGDCSPSTLSSDSAEQVKLHNYNEKLRRHTLRMKFIGLRDVLSFSKERSKRGILERAQADCIALKKDEQTLKELKKLLKDKQTLLQLYIRNLEGFRGKESDANIQINNDTLKDKICKMEQDLENLCRVYALTKS